ncbi:hypothetical protein GIB67_011071 [Kingdonia uniflora]|uniref:Uncharacterized protein n=1 Tax=Kingdonia uniflora TaxID=39325 RepID=A0A7J7L6G9_9MAGN|nr:hypothetical protein GIB67_011071 [Kingdonia uniflora]
MAMGVAAVVENIRLGVAIQEGFLDNPTAVIELSASWLIPQFVILGAIEAFAGVGQIEFYYSLLRKSIASFAMPFQTLGTAFFGFVGSLLIRIVNAVTSSGGRYWLYEYCGVGHPIVSNTLKMTSYPRLKAWEKGNRKKTNNQAENLFTISRYLIDHRTIESINWHPWDTFTALELDDVYIAPALSCKWMPLQVPNRNFEYYLGDRC